MTWQLWVVVITGLLGSNVIVALLMRRKTLAEVRVATAQAQKTEAEVSQMLQEGDIQFSDKEIDVVKKMSGVMGELISRNKELTGELLAAQREAGKLELTIVEMTKDRELVRHEIDSLERQISRMDEESARIRARLGEIQKSLDVQVH